ncbi:MAG: hypothetical protein HS113_26790 [Verrucomicrobiales bacterium]|nr:hypothetical protein [Verrucomicrobiales bacterium]
MPTTASETESPPAPAASADLAYASALLADAMGQGGSPLNVPASLAGQLWPYLTAQLDEDGDRRYRGVRSAPDLHAEFAALEQARPTDPSAPQLALARWPGAAPFALFLSHDIDQIYDRELFRVVADVNHIRRMLLSGERGSVPLASRRVLRALFRPKRTLWDFETILALEARHGFRSTFFVLHDRYWARQGARFSYDDREIREIGRLALAAGCELGVHGGYYRFNDAALYRQSREAMAEAFGVEAVGIRNHLLRYSFPDTWRAQEAAGFEYDATYGHRSVPGPRSGLAFPFFTYDPQRQEASNLLELPLTVMDTSVFRYLRLGGEEALEFCARLTERLAGHGALITLLWHNNFFNEPEYWDWHMVYERLLERLAALKPWCATGAEINRWWRARARVGVEAKPAENGRWEVRVRPAAPIKDLVIEIADGARWGTVTVTGAAHELQRRPERWRVLLPELAADTAVQLTLTPP